MGKILGCIILLLFSTPLKAELKKILEVSGVFYIEGPDGGFQWEKTKNGKSEKKISSYFAIKDGVKTILVLVVSDSKKETIDEKKAFSTKYFDDRVIQSEKAKDQILSSKKPRVKSDKSRRIDCWMKIKPPGKEMKVRHITFLFKERTYIFEARGPEKENPRKILDQFVAQFKEVKK